MDVWVSAVNISQISKYLLIAGSIFRKIIFTPNHFSPRYKKDLSGFKNLEGLETVPLRNKQDKLSEFHQHMNIARIAALQFNFYKIKPCGQPGNIK
jgi:hypothetical protein